jgi:hypothetical protein
MQEVYAFLAHQNRPRKMDTLNAQLDPELTTSVKRAVVDILAFIPHKRFVLQKMEAKKTVQVARENLERMNDRENVFRPLFAESLDEVDDLDKAEEFYNQLLGKYD